MTPGTRLKGYLVKHSQPIQKNAFDTYAGGVSGDFIKGQKAVNRDKKLRTDKNFNVEQQRKLIESNKDLETAAGYIDSIAEEYKAVPTMLENGARQAVNGISFMGGLPGNLYRGAAYTISNPGAAWRNVQHGWNYLQSNPWAAVGDGMDYLSRNGIFGYHDMVKYKRNRNDQYLTDAQKNQRYQLRSLAETAVSLPFDYAIWGGIGSGVTTASKLPLLRNVFAAVKAAPKSRKAITALRAVGNNTGQIIEGVANGGRQALTQSALEAIGKQPVQFVRNNWPEAIATYAAFNDPRDDHGEYNDPEVIDYAEYLRKQGINLHDPATASEFVSRLVQEENYTEQEANELVKAIRENQ